MSQSEAIADNLVPVMIGRMTKSAKVGLGCLAILIAIPVAYLFGLGWVRTVAPIAAPLTSRNLLIQLKAVDFKESWGVWPIVSTVTYPNVGPIRGEIRNHPGSGRNTDYRITIASPTGMAREIRCLRDYRDACYFHADLGQTDLTKGILISVADIRDGRTLVPPQLVTFTRRSSYSIALWDALMSV